MSMAFDWKEYLDLARYLQGHGGMSFSQEAAFRSSVSRAYYAAFCYARNYAVNKEGFIPKKTAADHERLRLHFQNRRKSDIADDLGDLRLWRNMCDYDDSVTNIKVLLSSAITQAQEIINKLP